VKSPTLAVAFSFLQSATAIHRDQGSVSVMPSLVSALVNRMPLADSVVSVGEATLAFQIVSSVSAVDVRTSATVKLVPASAVATTRVAATAIGELLFIF